MASERRVLVIGAASIDTKGRAHLAVRPGTSTPGAIRVSPGGVGRNIAENLARLGEPVVLLSAVGDDDSGHHILSQAAACGIDISHVIIDAGHHTAAYLAVVDENGRPLLSIHDMRIQHASITPHLIYLKRHLFRDASMLVVDGNLAPSALAGVFRLARKYRLPVCADPTTELLALRFVPFLQDLTLTTPNAGEAEALCGVQVVDRETAQKAALRLVSLGVQIVIVTMGATGLVYATSQQSGHVPAQECEIVDLTGAGDALTAAVVFGLRNSVSVDEAVRLGTSAAALTLTSRETVCPTLSLERLYDHLVI